MKKITLMFSLSSLLFAGLSLITGFIFADFLTQQNNREKQILDASIKDIFQTIEPIQLTPPDRHFTPPSLGVFDDQKLKIDVSSFFVPLDPTTLEIREQKIDSSTTSSVSSTSQSTPVEEQQ